MVAARIGVVAVGQVKGSEIHLIEKEIEIINELDMADSREGEM